MKLRTDTMADVRRECAERDIDPSQALEFMAMATGISMSMRQLTAYENTRGSLSAPATTCFRLFFLLYDHTDGFDAIWRQAS